MSEAGDPEVGIQDHDQKGAGNHADVLSLSAPGAEKLQEGLEAPPPGVRIMAVVRWVLVIAMATAAAASVISYVRGASSSSTSGASAASATVWTCPMHPQIRRDAPGQCPICGMNLVIAEQGSGGSQASANATVASAHDHEGMHDHAHPGVTSSASGAPSSFANPTPSETLGPVKGRATVSLSEERVQLVGMKLAPVTRKTLAASIRSLGFVSAAEGRVERVTSRFPGWIESLAVSETGRTVTRGQPLAILFSPQIYSAEQDYLTARSIGASIVGLGDAGVPTTGSVSSDARRRLELLGVPGGEIDLIERTGAPRKTTTIVARSSGVVTQKNVVAGQYVSAGADMFTIVDLSSVWILGDFYERDIARLKLGAKASLSLAAYADRTFDGTVSYVPPLIDSASRTVRIRIVMENRDGALRPGLAGDLVVSASERTALVMPTEALIDTGEAQFVFVQTAPGRFEPRAIRVGARSVGLVEVLAGLSEKETVVTTGNFMIDSESRLRAIADVPAAPASAVGAAPASDCDVRIDKTKYPDKYADCRACDAHRGMGSMETDCKNAIPKPWR